MYINKYYNSYKVYIIKNTPIRMYDMVIALIDYIITDNTVLEVVIN